MRYLITSALPYINGIKHLGNLIGSMLPGDVYARFLRQMGHEVLYVCGTDEHGTPAEIAAQEAGKPVKDYCAEMFLVQKKIYEQFGISFDYFGRSSSSSNHTLTTEFFQALEKNGFIEERSTQQYYCAEDGRFLPDRYVMGTCPHCDYETARGDQCDGCGHLLDPQELKNPYSSLSGSHQLELRESKHLFLQLNRMEDTLKEWIDQKTDWPPMTKGIAYKWLKEGLQPRCITRDLSWGIPVPKAGYEGKVFYVWFDAPIAYISITKDALGERYKDWWKPGGTTYYVEFMAKDNVPFHTIFFPAMVLASGLDVRLVDYLKSMSWLNYAGGKFSTSQKRGVFLDQALDLFPADYWRYYLMAHIPETDDTDFTFQHFADVINKDLVGGLGNFINRVLTLINKYTPQGIKPSSLPDTLRSELSLLLKHYSDGLYALKFRHAMEALRGLWRLGNSYIAEQEPWKRMNEEPEEALSVLAHCLHLIFIYAVTMEPVMPERARFIFDLLGLPSDFPEKADANFVSLLDFPLPKIRVQNQTLVFTKIPQETVDELTSRFSGSVGQGSPIK